MAGFDFPTANTARMKRPQLRELAAEILTWSKAFSTYDQSSNAAIRKMIEDAQTTYWNVQQANRLGIRVGPRHAVAVSDLPASEVNAWLQTLPEYLPAEAQ
jgi:hypothetical protein